MNKVRIVIGVLIVIALVHMGLESIKNGKLHASPVVFGLFGAWFVWSVWDGMISGVAHVADGMAADRAENPIGFWIVQGMWTLFAALNFALAFLAHLT